MTKPAARAAATPSPLRIALAVTLTVIVSLALLLAPRPSHAASDADVTGKWIVDKHAPELNYTIVAGAAPGMMRLIVPAKAVNAKADEVVILQRVGPGKFETLKGAVLRGSFTVTGPRNAEFKAVKNTASSFGIIDQLLERP
jgi:hypothetical protein